MSTTSTMKRLASPKMRHVRALSPYAQRQGAGAADTGKSFLSQYAMGGQAANGEQDEATK